MCVSGYDHMHTRITFVQEYEAAIKQMELEKVRVDHEERRKTMGAETEQHQRVRRLLGSRVLVYSTHVSVVLV